ncbi:hypothetical protein RRG08_065792 [Elysia crispata]|uniref:Uncharacterized protein n=1 Tax=Elysia crispata TaxID=231223 RepID=A0AAE1DLT2_9GAST|nr:hypothetical protein RRG08_065792 [Elysia crispata]
MREKILGTSIDLAMTSIDQCGVLSFCCSRKTREKETPLLPVAGLPSRGLTNNAADLGEMSAMVTLTLSTRNDSEVCRHSRQRPGLVAPPAEVPECRVYQR